MMGQMENERFRAMTAWRIRQNENVTRQKTEGQLQIEQYLKDPIIIAVVVESPKQ